MSATSSRTRREAYYPALIGLAVGALVVGLVLPWTIEDDGGTVTAGGASASLATGGDEESAVDPVTGEPIAEETEAGSPTATGGGTQGTSSSPQATTATGGPAAAPVGGEPIKLGFTLFEIGGAANLGFAIGVDPEEAKRSYQAFVDYANNTGGINGRRLEGVYSTYDLTNEDDQLSSCLELTEDHKVFAVIGGYSYSSANLCVVETHKTLLVNDNSFTIDELYRSNRHISMFTRGPRMMETLVRRLDKLDQIDGKTVGILADAGADPNGSTMDALAAAVEKYGGKIGRKSMLNGDFASGSSQIPVEVNQQRASGVQLVLLIASPLYGTQFAQQAESQGWQPEYAATDWQAMYSDVGGSNMPASFEGAISVTTTRTGEHRVNIPPPPVAEECKRIYEETTGTPLFSRDEDGYGLTMGACDVVGLFVRAARAGGADLSHGSVVGAAQRLGALESARWGGGSLAPGKFDVNDYFRINRFSHDCSCWMPTTPFSNE